MTTWLEGKRSFFLGSQAYILDDDRECASTWAAKYVQPNPANRWILGRYVEADRANNNRQKFTLAGLQMARPTVNHAPMNMNHQSRRVVGAYVATDLIYPTQTAADTVNNYSPTGQEMVPSMVTCKHCGEIYDETVNDKTCPQCLNKGEVIAPELEGAKDYTADQRKAMAGNGEALPDGSFPIKDRTDLKNAIHLAGRASDPSAARAHIIKRAKALGAEDTIPSSWSASEARLEAADTLNPYIEALGVFWKHYFPEEWSLIEAAHQEGQLYFSMECVSDQIQCTGDGGCGATFEYAGRISNTYCSHLNEAASDKLLIQPHFLAGAILIPPVRPGWSNANVHSLVAKHAELAEEIYNGVAAEMHHLDPAQWESIMGQLLTLATA